MGIFSNRKARKASSPSTGDDNISSAWGRSNVSNGGPSQLPVTSPRIRSNGGGGNNLLLFGGQYYPGKDKRRRTIGPTRRRRKLLGGRRAKRVMARLWECVFLRPTRNRQIARLLAVAFALYSVSYLIIFPLSSWIVDVRVNRAVDREWRVPNDPLLKLLPSEKEERQAVAKLQIELEALDAEGGAAERLKFIQELVPKFFHRNDVDHEDNNNNAPPTKTAPIDEQEQSETIPKASNTKETNSNSNKDGTSNIQEKGKQHIQKVEAAGSKKPSSKANPQSPKLRTLSTMADFTNETSCPANLEGGNVQITLVTQSTMDRLWILEETCQRWHDPIVAVVPLTEAQRQDETVAMSLGQWTERYPHLQVVEHFLESSKPQDYPVNLLRNVGLNAVRTSHILLADIDFVPSLDLDQTIRNTLQLTETLRENHLPMPASAIRDAMVVPAFERILPEPCASADECKQHLSQNSSFIPHSFDDLKKCVKDEECIVFQSKVNWEGHYTTDSEAWLDKDWYDGPAAKINGVTLRNIRQIECFDTLRYEPYLVLRWCPSMESARPLEAVAPYYDERFHGYGKNKISYIQHLRLSGYRFSVLPRGFLVHNPHLESTAKEVWSKQGSSLHHGMDRLYFDFLKELVHLYRPQEGQIVDSCNYKKQ